MSPRRPAALVLALIPLSLAACGGGGGGGNAGTTQSGGGGGSNTGGQKLTLQADKSALAFSTKSLQAKAGKVTIVMTNPSSTPHDVAITGSGVSETGPVVQNGGESSVTADLKPGTYTFFCSVDGHEAAGMKGTLTVK
jgi:plastocyanin